jgi:uncharacterized MAPEG superfamily protein
MTIALWCILLAGLLPYALAMAAKAGTRYDNATPRLQAASGWRQRADWAQQNGWEAFAPFAAAVLVAHWTHAAQGTVDLLALAFVALRIAHAAAYIGDRPSLRSAMWACGVLCVIGLYIVAARA